MEKIEIIIAFQVEKDAKFSEKSQHIAQIGQMVEDMENKVLHTIKEINYSITKDVVNSMRHIQSLADEEAKQMNLARVSMAHGHLHNALQMDLAKALQRRNASHDE